MKRWGQILTGLAVVTVGLTLPLDNQGHMGDHGADDQLAATTSSSSKQSMDGAVVATPASQSSCASQQTPQEAAAASMSAQVASEQSRLTQLQGELSATESGSGEAAGLTQTIKDSQTTLDSDMATLEELQKEAANSTSVSDAQTQAQTQTTTTQAEAATTVAANAAAQEAATQTAKSTAAAKSNGYRIVNDRVVDQKGAIVSDWTIKDGQAYDENGNQIKLKKDTQPSTCTTKAKLTTPKHHQAIENNDGKVSDVSDHRWRIDWMGLTDKVASWFQ